MTDITTKLADALREIEVLEAENEALRKDAERYRWLRDPKNHEQLGVGQWIGDDRFNWLTATEADAAIDAAMKEADK